MQHAACLMWIWKGMESIDLPGLKPGLAPQGLRKTWHETVPTKSLAERDSMCIAMRYGH